MALSSTPACNSNVPVVGQLATFALIEAALFRRLGDIDRLARLAEYFLQHRFKGLKRHRSEIGIEGDLIEQAAEFLGLLEMRMPAELLAHVPVEPQVVEEVIPLEDAVMLDHPMVLLRHEGLDDGGGDVGVIVRAERIADIVQQRADHIFLVPARLKRAGRGLQAVLQAIDGEPAVVAVEQFEMGDQTIRQLLREALQLTSDQLPVFLRAFGIA